ncbi:hypothetical protein BDR07DRAFT_1451925 [Suillus spraguei]|nr:hypothetical protein BDR07DRAFT_1451925 [Suillus spraguei]
MAEFLFLQNQTSAKQIDTLLDLWAASLIKHDDAPPFTGHRDLYNTINATPHGDIPWETFSMSYNGAKPLHDIPPWMDVTYDIIAQNEATHRSTFMPLIIGSYKMTVSVATGHTEYHPLYMSIGNIFNSTQCAHHNGVVLVGFLAIPKTTKEHAGSYTGLGPYIADYPGQVLLSGVCLADRRDLDGDRPCLRQCEKHRELLVEELEYGKLWEEYGIVGDVVPFMNNYPRADIHELISPDILHQIIKGTFKDHLVDWVESYLKITHGASQAAQIMDNIDNKIAAVSSFTGLRQFPEGHRFKQWTGNDSKALMKVYLPAIRGHVPDDIVCTFSAFLDFCYIVRRDTLTEDDLLQLQDALDRFHRYQEIFKTTGVTLSFSLLHQHSLNHYLLLIRQFGVPNGLCSSIMESKHIKAIKEPWRCSSWFKACGMLKGSCLSEALHKLRKHNWPGFLNVNEPEHRSIEGEVSETVDGPAVEAHVDLAATPCCKCDVHALGDKLELPNFQQLIQEFIHDQAYTADPDPPVFDPASALLFLGKVSIFNSAATSFYAPSDLSSTGGMQHEHIHTVSSWCGGAPRYDCVFVNMNTDTDIMNGLAVAQHPHIFFQCAVVQWFSHVLGAHCYSLRNTHDPDTGMYVVAPRTLEDDTPDISIIHIDYIFCTAHLIPVYGSSILPRAITSHDSYDVFHSYFVNKYADHHAFEIA